MSLRADVMTLANSNQAHPFAGCGILDPVHVDLELSDATWRIELLRRYYSSGYAVFDFGDRASERDLLRFLSFIGLDIPYIPQQYTERPEVYNGFGFNVIGAKADTSEVRHRAFETSLPQTLHCDGTLEPIGAIPTSVLYCDVSAWCGGVTIVFDAARAFEHLISVSPRANCLELENALSRRDVGYTEKVRVGPVFTVQQGEILSRFSIDNTSQWHTEELPFLRESQEALMELAASPRYSHCFKLSSGQGVIMANDRLAHGRTAYIDNSEPRRLSRVLYAHRPTLTSRGAESSASASKA